MINITKPKFKKTISFLERLETFDPQPILHEYGQAGVAALAGGTPVDTGETASKWSYKVERKGEQYKIIWSNSEMAGSAPLVLMLQYGHATKSGYFLSGRDFINPALRPIYDSLHERLMEEALNG
jgi:hypothetical protein